MKKTKMIPLLIAILSICNSISATPPANLHCPKHSKGLEYFFVNVKVFLQGAYSSSLGRHKDVTSTWASVLNANAITQPYNVTPWNYNGSDGVAPGSFAATSGTTDIVDWVLLELRDQNDPSHIINTCAALVREDGQVVATNGTSYPAFLFANDESNYYYIAIRHRNHLSIRSANPVYFTSNNYLASYDFTTAQSQAYQNTAITQNEAMVEVSTGVFAMHAGNANKIRGVSFTGISNDNVAILAALSGNQAAILSSVYRTEDVNLDGTVRFTGFNNDAAYLLSYLSANQAALYLEHL